MYNVGRELIYFKTVSLFASLCASVSNFTREEGIYENKTSYDCWMIRTMGYAAF